MSDLLLFGYGSLVWRPGEVQFVESRTAHVRGFKRRFWQRSEDHRGVPGAAGRVCVCVPWDTCRDVDRHQPASADEARVAGRLFRVDAALADATLAYLDIREKGGYSSIRVPVYDAEGALLADEAVLFSATTDNEFFEAEADLDKIASVVASSVGPSGPNTEYLARLAEWLRENNCDDAHVLELDRIVKERSQ